MRCGCTRCKTPSATPRTTQHLNAFIKTYGLEIDLQRRLREYFHQTKHHQVAAAHRKLLDMMSPALQGEVTWVVNHRWIQHVWVFEDTEPQFMVHLALRVR